jgi:NAD(P)-dependent dehydrogenase (short-subunit alcohol dehydrogenase family)
MTAQTVVVTGANRGIGLEICRVHAARGDRVIAGCRSPEGADALRSLDPSAILALDVGDEATVAQFGAAVTGELDGASLDRLYNNAGSSTTNLGLSRRDAGVLDVSMAITEELIRINGLSAATVSRALVDAMADGSKIINVSSQIGSMVVAKMFADLPYSTSKAVMNMVTVQLANALSDRGVTVACFHPGWVRTDMGGEAADLSPEESAAGIVEVSDGLTGAESGGFFRHDGSVHPW